MGIFIRRPPKLKVAPSAHPLVHWLFHEMYEQQISTKDMGTKSGVRHYTLTDWRIRTTPNLSNFEACANVLGYTILPKEIKYEEAKNTKSLRESSKATTTDSETEQETL